MPMIVKWVDARAAKIPARVWRRIKRKLRPLTGTKRQYLAADVERALRLPSGSLQTATRPPR